MSLKKDSFNSIDKKYMKLAINLARNQEGFTGNNPPVGCIIVKNNQIVSYGVTSYNGRPHAETIALNKNKKKKYWIYCLFIIGTLFALWQNTAMHKSSN